MRCLYAIVVGAAIGVWFLVEAEDADDPAPKLIVVDPPKPLPSLTPELWMPPGADAGD